MKARAEITGRKTGSIDLGTIRKTAISQTLQALACLATDVTEMIGRTAEPYKIRTLFSRMARDLHAECISSLLGNCGNEDVATMKTAVNSGGDERALRFTMKQIIYPEIALGSEKAASLLCYYAVYLDSAEARLARELLAKVGKLATARPVVAKALDRTMTFHKLDPSLLSTLFAVDEARALELAQRLIHIGNEQERGAALRLLTDYELPDWCYRNAVEFCRFWDRGKLKEDDEMRIAFYALVHRAFVKKCIDTRQALENLRPAFKYECYDRGFEPLMGTILTVDPENGLDIISDGLIMAYRGKGPAYLDDSFKAHLKALPREKKIRFLSQILLRLPDGDRTWKAACQIMSVGSIDEVCNIFAKAMRFDRCSHTVCQLILRLQDRQDFAAERKGKSAADLERLLDTAIDAMSQAKRLSPAFSLVKAFACFGSEDQATITLDRAVQLAEQAKNDAKIFREIVQVIWLIRYRHRKLVKRADEALASLMPAYERQIVDTAYDIIRKDISYGGDRLSYEAAQFLIAVNHLASVPIMGDLLNSKKSNYNTKAYLVGFLEHIASADPEHASAAIVFLRANDGCNISHELIPKTMARLYWATDSQALKDGLAEASADRLMRSIRKTESMSYFCEADAVEAMKDSLTARRGFVDALRLMPDADSPTPGFATIISKTTGVIPESEWLDAREALVEVVNRFTALMRTKREQADRDRSYRSSFQSFTETAGHIITAAHAQILEMT